LEPYGWQACPVASDQRLEASLASEQGNPPGEAETASRKALRLSAERPFAGAFAFLIPGATLRHCTGLVHAVPPASTEQGKRTIGVSREPGRSCRLLSANPGRRPGSPTPGPGGALVRRGANRTSARCGTAKRRQRSAAGRAAGSRSALIVPMKQGNSPQRTLWREAKCRPTDSIEGHRWNTSRFRLPVHVIRSDSFGDRCGWQICRLRNQMR